MFAILHALGMFVPDLFKSRTRLEAENLFLRHQLTIALRQAPPRFRLRSSDRDSRGGDLCSSKCMRRLIEQLELGR